MDNIERKAFWDKLVSLKGDNYIEESKELQNTIKYPKYLYRYRPLTIKSLEALQTNRMFFSTANYYDDPFDTFINIDISGLKSTIDIIKKIGSENVKDVESFIGGFFQSIGENIPANLIEDNTSSLLSKIHDPRFIDNAIDYVRNIRNEVKKSIWSVCFSETGTNEVLWLKYAQQHKGFVLRYDMDKPELLLCGKQSKCKSCIVNQVGESLYPVYYSQEKYDGTRYGQFISVSKFLNLNKEQHESLQKLFGITNWESLKVSLIKNEYHHYDDEWRIIINCLTDIPICQEWVPGAVVLGLNMGSNEKKLVKSLAIEAGIKEIFQCIINDDGNLDMISAL